MKRSHTSNDTPKMAQPLDIHLASEDHTGDRLLVHNSKNGGLGCFNSIWLIAANRFCVMCKEPEVEVAHYTLQ